MALWQSVHQSVVRCCASRRRASEKKTEAEDSFQPSLLQLAEEDDTEAVKLALAKGLDPNLQDERGTTALLVSIRNGFTDTVEALLAGRADVNKAGAWKYTPLMYAAIWKQPVCASYLL